MATPLLRTAVAADAAALCDIYNHYVRTDTCTYTETLDDPAARAAWLAGHGPRHPVVVLEHQGEVVAWGALSAFRERSGYRHTVEDSIYCREDWRGRGLGRRLLDHLVAEAKALGHHAIIAAISADQPRSLALHARAGFTEVARLREVGTKFGRWLDVVYLELLLNTAPPPAPR